jgi:regulatory protein
MYKKSSPIDKSTPKKRKKITQSYLENSGAYYLERFSASISQFRKVMTRKIDLSCRDHPEQNKQICMSMLDKVVEKFEHLGYLNDNNYGRILVSSLQNKGVSHTRLLITLRLKGLSEDIIEQIVPERDADLDRKAAIRWAKKKRLGPFAIRIRENDLNRSLSSLARAGFDYDIAKWVMSLDLREAEDLL